MARLQQLPLALGLELGAALGALREMGLDGVVLGGLEPAREVPRQQPLHGGVRIGFEVKDLTAHASLRSARGACPDVIIGHFGCGVGHSQSSSWPPKAVFRRLRAWNMRVLTVSVGHSTICAISG